MQRHTSDVCRADVVLGTRYMAVVARLDSAYDLTEGLRLVQAVMFVVRSEFLEIGGVSSVHTPALPRCMGLLKGAWHATNCTLTVDGFSPGSVPGIPWNDASNDFAIGMVVVRCVAAGHAAGSDAGKYETPLHATLSRELY